MAGRGKGCKRTFDRSKNEAIEFRRLCLAVADDRKTVGNDGVDLGLDEFRDKRQSRMLCFSDDAADAVGGISHLREDVIEVGVPASMAVKHDTKVSCRGSDWKRLAGDGEGKCRSDCVLVFAVLFVFIAEEDDTTLLHIKEHPPICCPL